MAWPIRLKVPWESREQQQPSLQVPGLGPALTSSSLSAWLASSPCPVEPSLLGGIWARETDGAEAVWEAAAVSGAGGGDAPLLQLLFPCALRPAVSPKGLDLQLKLFQLQLGAPQPHTESSSSSGASSGASSFVLRRRAAQPARLQQQQQAGPALLNMLDKAAGLLAARLLFPDAALPVVRLLAAAHCASAAVQVSSLLLSPAARAARHRMGMWSAAPLAGAAVRGARQLASVLQRYGEPAFVLLAVAALWARLHPSSQQIGECIAGAPSIPLLLSCMTVLRLGHAHSLPSLAAPVFKPGC